MSPFEYILLSSFAIFWTMEAICHFALHNAPGSETISHRWRRVAQALTGRYWHFASAVPPLLFLLDLEGWL